jgi:hypothetical protein
MPEVFPSRGRCFLFAPVLCGLLLGTVSCSGLSQRSGVTSVWAVNESEKVRRDDLDHPARAGQSDSLWDGRTIRLFGARNEVVGFQVVLEAGGVGAEGVDLRLDSLRADTSVIKNTPKSNDPFDFRGKNIELFLEHYVLVKERSDWWLASARPLPDDLHTGWIPDALVPFSAPGPQGKGIVPFSIAEKNLQAVWIDIYIPHNTAPGLYRGVVRVMEHATTTFTVPVELQVYDFSLPDTTHLHNHFFWGWPTIAARHGYERDSRYYLEVFHAYEKLFHRHRLDLIDGSRTLDEFRALIADYYTGKAFTPERGYDGPGVGVGQQSYSIGTYDQPTDGWRSGFYPDTREAWQKASDAWEGWFQKSAPAVWRFKYMEDEPPYSHWRSIREKGLWIREGKGIGRSLGVHVTTRMGDDLLGAITIWMTGGHAGWRDSGGTTGFDLPRARQRQAAGEKVGFYNGQRPSYADPLTIDNFAADARANPWIAWKYHADMYFVWETAFYADGGRNAWQQVVAGSLLYTGEDRKYPADSRSLAGPVASIRLKNLRRGFQDYEYLWLAHRNGIDTRPFVDPVVPTAFNEYNGTTFTSQSDQPTWAEHGDAYEKARRALARVLGGRGSGSGTQTGTTTSEKGK